MNRIFGDSQKNMFHSGKKKPLAQVFRDGNSSNRSVGDLSKNEDKLLNSSFDSAQSSLGKKPNLKQTQIVVRRSLKRPHNLLNDSFTTAEKLETKTELFLMPMPKLKANDNNRVKLNATVCGGGENSPKPSFAWKANNSTEQTPDPAEIISENKPPNDPLDNTQRSMKVFVGNVGFVTKTTKLYPKINALWDIYGKLLKISKGKHRFEQILLIRNVDDSGPILQCTYFDFNRTLNNIAIGSNVRVVGKSNGFNCLRTFKIEPYERNIPHSNVMRLHNVNSFVLLQSLNAKDSK